MPDRWVCLLYHDITPASSGVGGGPEHFAVTRATFADQLDTLRCHGWEGVTLEQALVPSTRQRIAISFDDGDEGQYHQAVPELVSRGMTATFFITTTWVGRRGYVTWDQLREMRDAGMSIQSHTRTHPFLSLLGHDQLTEELRGAREELYAHLGHEPTTLAFPGGDPPRRQLRHLLLDAGYQTIATSRWGGNAPNAAAHPVRYIRRCTLRGEPSQDYFRRVVALDRWLLARRTIRDGGLRTLRTMLGRTRYAAWRRRVLDVVGG